MKITMLMVLFSILIAILSLALGITTPAIPVVPESLPSAEAGGGLLDSFRAFAAPFIWVFNVTASLFQLVTFQAVGIPPLVNTVLITPLAYAMLYTVIRLIRGGG